MDNTNEVWEDPITGDVILDETAVATTMLRQLLADKGMNDVFIVVDGNNVAEIRQHLEKQHDAANILMQEMKIPYHAPIELPEIKIVELTNFNQTNKPKKPNKGIALGSYKFTSKKK